MHRFAHRSGAGTARFPAVILILTILLATAGCREDPGPEVWVVGLDGADWDLLDPMIARGEMPHLAALRDGGAAGVLRSEKPLISPVLWTTIATGKSPDQHGITWFMTEDDDGTRIPVSSTQRRVRPVWHIAAENGLRSGVIGWWATWPADPLDGFIISDYVGWHSFGVTGRDAASTGRTWPPDLASRTAALMPEAAQIPAADLARMVHRPARELAHDPNASPYEDPLAHLRQAIATSRGYTDLALDRLANDRPRFLGVYYEGTDAVMHLFGDHQPPRQPWVDPADFAAYKDVVAEYWRWQDELLGELLEKRGPQTTVVVISDHGFRVGDERRKEDHFHIETADADHMFDGVVVINGPGIAPGTRLEGADLYDVAPTVLHLLDLPVGADMPGRVLTDALEPAVLAAAPVRSVVTHETGPLPRADAVVGAAEATDSLEEMLRSLGYIAGDSHPAVAAAPEQTVNLATVLMHQGRHREAVVALREADAADPGVMEIRLNLAQALARAGSNEEVAEGERIYRGLVAEHPDRLEPREDLATLLLNQGRPGDALAVCDAGLTGHPAWLNGLVARGQALAALDRLDEAEDALRQAVQENPRHARAQFAWGDVLLAAGHGDAGRQALDTAHHLAPDDAQVAVRYAGQLRQTGDLERALAVLTDCLDSGGPRAAVLAEQGALLLQLGRIREAVPSLQDAVARDPQNVLALGNLGMAHAMGGEMPEAVAAFENVVRVAPDMADGHAQLGALYAESGDLGRAVQELETATRQDPGNAGAWLNLGRVHGMRGEDGRARTALRQALQVDPEFKPALLALGELERKTGHPREAARLLQRAGVRAGTGRTGP